MKDSDFVFDCIDPLHFQGQKKSLNCSISYIASTNWMKITISPKNNGNICFLDVVIVALNYEKLENVRKKI